MHDFRGFPKALYDVQYPAKESLVLAKQNRNIVSKTEVHLDENGGLDHGAWSFIKHMYPDADEFGFDSAIEDSTALKRCIEKGDHMPLVEYSKQGRAFKLAIPTPEHFLPLRYILALRDKKDTLILFITTRP